MFGKLQRQMTILHTLILISVLAVTNLTVYFLLQSYNVSQMAGEAVGMLNSLQESVWMNEDESETVPQTIDVDDLIPESPSPVPGKDDGKDDDQKDDDSDLPREPTQTDEHDDDDMEEGSYKVPDETPNMPIPLGSPAKQTVSFTHSGEAYNLVSAQSTVQTVQSESAASPSGGSKDASTANGIKTGNVRTLYVPSVLRQFSFFLVFDLDGNLTSHNLGNRQTLNSLMELAPDIQADSRPEVRILASGPLSRALLLRRSIEIDGVLYGSFLVGRDLNLVTETMSNLRLILIFSFIAGVLVSILIGYLLAGRAIRPIREAYEAKQRFLADASHELRTPISVVLLSAESLDRALPEDQEEARADLSDIREEAFRMRDLVERLLFLARSDNRRNLSGKEKVDLVPLLNDVTDSLDTLAKARNITLELRNPSHLVCLGDEKMLSTLFTVLVENAIKYNRDGGRVIVEGMEICPKNRTWLDIRLKRQKWLEIRIADTGIGIPESEQARIFQRFYRADISRSQQTGGHGLGLAIAKEIAEAHDGTVQVVSQPDIGTTFTVRLHCASDAFHKSYNSCSVTPKAPR